MRSFRELYLYAILVLVLGLLLGTTADDLCLGYQPPLVNPYSKCYMQNRCTKVHCSSSFLKHSITTTGTFKGCNTEGAVEALVELEIDYTAGVFKRTFSSSVREPVVGLSILNTDNSQYHATAMLDFQSFYNDTLPSYIKLELVLDIPASYIQDVRAKIDNGPLQISVFHIRFPDISSCSKDNKVKGWYEGLTTFERYALIIGAALAGLLIIILLVIMCCFCGPSEVQRAPKAKYSKYSRADRA